MPKGKLCEVDGCIKPLKSRSMCEMHYMRWHRATYPKKITSEARSKRNAKLAIWRETRRQKLRDYQREYMRQRRASNPERAREQSRKDGARARAVRGDELREYNRRFYHLMSLEEKRKRAAQNRISSREAIRASAKRWGQRNPGKKNAETAKRRARKKQAMPQWVDQRAIRAVYVACKRLCRETGENYEVDHIVPLQGVNVCGLHVPWNLQIILSEENRRKANKLAA